MVDQVVMEPMPPMERMVMMAELEEPEGPGVTVESGALLETFSLLELTLAQ